MNRILFAAARGARVQRLWFRMKDEPYNWGISRVLPVAPESDYDYRVHPEDAHLAYGPISTALRKMAIDGDVYAAEIPYIHGYWDFTREEACVFIENSKHRSLFLLILAEALADEGL